MILEILWYQCLSVETCIDFIATKISIGGTVIMPCLKIGLHLSNGLALDKALTFFPKRHFMPTLSFYKLVSSAYSKVLRIDDLVLEKLLFRNTFFLKKTFFIFCIAHQYEQTGYFSSPRTDSSILDSHL